MKYIVGLVLFLMSGIMFSANAQFVGEIEVVTVEQVKEMRDDTNVVLEGSIIRQIADEDYLFRDETGEIQVEIDDDVWKNQQVDSDTTVRIMGEFDKGFRNMEIEVDRLEIIE